MLSFYIITLVLAGLVAGCVNFFTGYVNIPFTRTTANFDAVDPTKLKDKWYVALIGYLVVGIAGSSLTPLFEALMGGLKGIINTSPISSWGIKEYFIFFGYGLVFGYSTSRLLNSLLDILLKKVVALENRMKNVENIPNISMPK